MKEKYRALFKTDDATIRKMDNLLKYGAVGVGVAFAGSLYLWKKFHKSMDETMDEAVTAFDIDWEDRYE